MRGVCPTLRAEQTPQCTPGGVALMIAQIPPHGQTRVEDRMRRYLQIFWVALVTTATCFLSSPSRADAVVRYRDYPDPANGPNFMETSCNLIDPEQGSGWAFGGITVCGIRVIPISDASIRS